MKKDTQLELSSSDPILSGHTDGSKLSVAVVVASYNTKISQGLLDGCMLGLDQCNVTNRKVIDIEGSFELPLVAQKCIDSYDAVICLGAVIKGDTAHFEYVSDQTAKGIQDVMLKFTKPVVFGVLTTYTFEQALVRAMPDENNKGLEAALTAVKMCNVLEGLSS